MSGAREQLTRLYRAAVAGADVESLTSNAVSAIHLERRHRVWIFAIGKAAHRMAAAAVSTAQRALADVAGGVIIAPDAAPPPNGTIAALVGDHPIPGARSFAAASRLQDIVSRKRGTDVGIVLLSGGASSLMAAPLRGMDGGELTALYELLLGSGLDIAQMNAIRKRFSYWAGGRLALGLAPAQSHCFALSDVPGDDLAVIGSGPCVPDPTRAADVVALLEGARLHQKISPAFRRFLADSARGVIPETPKATHPAFAHMKARVIGNNAAALKGAVEAARELGLPAAVMEPLSGDARATGERIATQLLRERESMTGHGPRCIIWGGETTVTLPPDAPPGGRCQAIALSAAQRLAAAGDRGAGITLLAAGTDGRDGTTTAAGAIVDADTVAAIRGAGIDPANALERHDAHRALGAANALFSPGPTGTNVMDVAIGLIQ